tara:strand:- start:3460 stop:4509 length:1050 start_codon:yes stop_codon:yes gene_type:complete
VKIPNSNHIKVEELRIKHFSMLHNIKNIKLQNKLQSKFISNLALQTQENLFKFIPKKSSLMLIALRGNLPIAFLEVKPYNIQGTCFIIQPIKILTSSDKDNISMRDIIQPFFESIISEGNLKAKSLIIRSTYQNKEILRLSRENGFQKLKAINIMKYQGKLEAFTQDKISSEVNYEWQKINKENAISLFRLEQTSESSHLRQILDRQWKDLLNYENDINRIIRIKNFKYSNPIAGLVQRSVTENCVSIELVRDCSWDERLFYIIPNLINEFKKEQKEVLIEINAEDDKMTILMERFGWVIHDVEILLARSIWRRRVSSRHISAASSIEDIIGNLNPQQPPLPSPSLRQR